MIVAHSVLPRWEAWCAAVELVAWIMARQSVGGVSFPSVPLTSPLPHRTMLYKSTPTHTVPIPLATLATNAYHHLCTVHAAC